MEPSLSLVESSSLVRLATVAINCAFSCCSAAMFTVSDNVPSTCIEDRMVSDQACLGNFFVTFSAFFYNEINAFQQR